MKKWFMALAFFMPMFTWAFSPVAGQDYQQVATPGPSGEKGQVIVQEFFWYGCSHCYHLEPHVAKWKKTLPANVKFERIPAALNPTWETNARGFYVAESLGLVDKTHDALFAAIHVDRQRLFNANGLAKFYGQYGVQESNFRGLYNSFAINGKVARSNQLAKFYQLTGVPAMVVNGKYVVPGSSARTIQTVNALIAKEQAK